MDPVLAGSTAAREALALPRSAWQSHPRFATQTLLLHSHEHFRAISRRLVQHAQRGGDTHAVRAVFRAWKAGMHSHEGYEEYKLYPYLMYRWGLDLSPLEAGHRSLAVEEQAVRAHAEEDGPATEALVHAIQRHHEVLMDHLDHEERVVIPALLALTPDEFERYATSTLAMLLREPVV